MSRTRLVSLAVLTAILICIAQSALAAGPYVVPNGVAPPSTDPAPDGLQTWLEAMWWSLHDLVDWVSTSLRQG